MSVVIDIPQKVMLMRFAVCEAEDIPDYAFGSERVTRDRYNNPRKVLWMLVMHQLGFLGREWAKVQCGYGVNASFVTACERTLHGRFVRANRIYEEAVKDLTSSDARRIMDLNLRLRGRLQRR